MPAHLTKITAILTQEHSPYHSTMPRLLSYLTLFLPLLPTLISAQCASCDSYTSALKSCQTSSNVTAVGTQMDPTTIRCMCSSKSGTTDMNACQGCLMATPDTDVSPTVLLAWTTTCTADSQFGDKQAAICWQSQPDNFIPCVSKNSGGSGGGSGGTSGGGDVATTSGTGSASR